MITLSKSQKIKIINKGKKKVKLHKREPHKTITDILSRYFQDRKETKKREWLKTKMQ